MHEYERRARRARKDAELASDAAPVAVERDLTAETDGIEERIAAGRAKHGVGSSEDFPGNVCHLVSPIVGHLRLRQRDGEAIPDLGHIIDRLSLVLDMARQEAERALRPGERS